MSVNVESIPSKGHQRLLKLADFLDTLPEDSLNMLSWFRTEDGPGASVNHLYDTEVKAGEEHGVFVRQDPHTFTLTPNVSFATMKECGFAACAIGWAGSIPEFIADGFTMQAFWTDSDIFHASGAAPYPRYKTHIGYSAVEGFFQLDPGYLSKYNGDSAVGYLFGPTAYGEQSPPPSTVAARIRQFVLDHQERFSV